MIVLDDQLSAPYLKSEIENWYAGSVVVLGSLRPHRIIKDDNIPALLQELKPRRDRADTLDTQS